MQNTVAAACMFVCYRWYHGALTRSEAESLLTLCKECSYLVRNSQTSRNDYSLSLRYCIVVCFPSHSLDTIPLCD